MTAVAHDAGDLPAAARTDRFKVTSLAAYGEAKDHTIELDHRMSPEIGAPTRRRTSEVHRAGATGTTNPKDPVEHALHPPACDHKVTLVPARDAIAGNRVTALQVLGL